MKRAALGLIVCASLSGVLSAQSVSLKGLAWMEGRWVDDSGGNLSEEVWSAPSGDSILGMWRLLVDDRARLFELLSIQARADGVVLRLRHFDSGLVGWEPREKPLELTLIASGDGEARFEGPAVSSAGTVAITYRHPRPDTLACTVERGGKKEEFTFRRASSPARP